jgi:hypothetical protein
MANSNTSDIDSLLDYRVELAESIQVGRARIHPGPRVILRGDVLISIKATNPTAVTNYAVEG